jgi:DNA-binding CsgD family transcriptional regulator/tetratricopeptide (TPR) repeat protein
MTGPKGPPPVDLVGRDAALATLEHAVHLAVTGEGHAWHIIGEAGSGKTSLLSAAHRDLRRRGVAVLATAADDIDRRRSYSVFRTLLQHHDLADTTDPIGTVLDRIERAILESPLAVIVDDVHWADPESVDCLAAMARRVQPLGVLLVTAGRPAQVGSALLRYQAKVERWGTVTVLDSLTDHELDELVVQRMGSHAGPRLRKLLSGTAGNPFLATELLASLDHDRQLHRQGPVVEVTATALPRDLKVRLGQAALAAAGDGSMLLRAAAVIPGGFTMEELADVLDIPTMQVMEDVLRLQEERVLEEREFRLMFRHDIIRQSIVGATPTSVVRALNRRALAVFRNRPGNELRVADFLLASANPAEPSDRSELLQLGRQLAPHQPLAAVDLLGSALDHLPEDDPETLDATLVYGWALVDVGRAPEVGAFLDSRTITRQPGVRVLDQLRSNALILCGDFQSVLDHYSAGFERADTAGRETVNGIAELALVAVLGGRIERSRQAIAWTDQAGTRPTPASAAHLEHARAWLLGIDGHLEDALDAANTSLGLLEGDTSAGAQRGRPYVVTAILLDALGRSGEAIALTRQLAATASPVWNRSILHSASALLHLRRGEWDDALTEISAGLNLADEMELRLGIVWPHALSAIICAARGEVAAARQWLARCQAEVPPGSMGAELLGYSAALVSEAGGDGDGAAAISGVVVDTVLETGAPGLLFNLCADAQRLAMAAGDERRADSLDQALRQLAGRTGSPIVHALRDWVCGLRAGDGDLIVGAASTLGAHARVWEAARANHDSAVIVAAGADHGRARKLAGKAFEAYDGLGADLFHARLRAELRSHGLNIRPRRRPPRPSSGWESLTPTERTIVELVAMGMANTEIASQLFVSRRTIESHLARVYPKLGLCRRTELVAAARTAL